MILLGSIVELRVRPCGACSEFVSVSTGCRHWRPDSPPATRHRLSLRPPEARPLNNPVVMARLMDGQGRHILAAACLAPSGQVAIGDKRRRDLANRLVSYGLLTRDRVGGPYAVTSEGRATYQRIREMEYRADAGRG